MADKANDWVVEGGGFDNLPDEEKYKPRRFWIPPGEEKELVFLDGDQMFSPREPFKFYEHQFFHDGSWNNYETCVPGKKDGKNLCFFCSPKMKAVKSNRRYFVGAFTVIVTTPYKIKKGPRKGKVVTNMPMLLCAKIKSLKTMSRKLMKHKVLVGAKFSAYRTDEESAGIGDEFELIEHLLEPNWVIEQSKKGETGFNAVMDAIATKLEITQDEKNPLQPFDYASIFQPRTWEEHEADYGDLLRGGNMPPQKSGRRRSDSTDETTTTATVEYEA
jgi:hypothetical protein